MKTELTIIAVVASLFTVNESAKILGLFPTFGRSHLIVHMSVVKVMADRGHDVTVVTTLPLSDLGPNMRHIRVNASQFPEELISELTTSKHTNFWQRLYLISTHVMEISNATLYDPQMQKLMREESFDLMVLGYFFNHFQIGVAAHFKCPYVISFPQRPVPMMNNILGSPSEPLYVPHVITGDAQPLGFFGRLKSVIAHIIDCIVYSVVNYKEALYYESLFPAGKYPSYDEMRKNVSLILSSHHFTNGPIVPIVPALIQIGGIQIKPKPDPLPQDIKQFLDEASTDGAIFFSLGSTARTFDLKSNIVGSIFRVLANLKQRVVWKWDDDNIPGKSKNILFKKWLPQDDVLAHPNVKLFITQGGHGSRTESEYHGVPMVGLPLFSDQFSNMKAVVKAGYGLSLMITEMTEETFKSTLMEVLENPIYTKKVKTFSRLYRDRPLNARDTAAFWMEYVLRHKGARHMQSPAVHMNTIQYYGIDIALFIISLLYVVFKVIRFMFKKTYFLIFAKSEKPEFRTENKKLK